MLPTDLSPSWRSLAETFREHAAEPLALAYERCAEQLDLALAQADDELLTVTQAAAETGYSQRHLRRMVADGTIRQAGTPNRPRLLRSELPRKPGHGIALPRPEPASSITQVARAIATRGEDDGST